MVGFCSNEMSAEEARREIIVKCSGTIYNLAEASVEKTIETMFQENATACFKELDGKFAVVIWKPKENTVVLARDRSGQEPLYYHVSKEGVYYASDIKMLTKVCNKSFGIDMEALANYMWNMYIPAPYSIFKGVRKVKPSCFVSINLKTGKISEGRYWNGKEIYNEAVLTRGEKSVAVEEYIAKFGSVVSDAVMKRIPSDERVGVYLSSGFDSTLVAAMAKEVSDQKLHSFTIGFEEPEFNEDDVAREIAHQIGTEHHEKKCSVRDAIQYLRKIPKVYSEPFADNSQIPMMMLSEFASEHVGVVLSGDGGDELLCGYPHYYQSAKYIKTKMLSSLLNMMEFAGPKDCFDYAYWRWNKFANMTEDRRIINVDVLTAMPIISRLLRKDKIFEIHPEYMNEAISEGTLVEKFGFWGMQMPLEGDSLVKVDRVAREYFLDNRMPFLGNDVLEMSMRMPIDVKYREGLTKYPIRCLVYERVPRELMDGPKKGFGIPINKWLRAELGEQLAAYFEPRFVRNQNLFDEIEIQQFYKAFKEKPSPILDRIAWTYFCFQMWWEEYCVKE